MTTTRIICGSTHGAWDEWGAHCSICHPARCTCADEGARYSTIRCPVHGAAVTYQPDPRDAEIARLLTDVDQLMADLTRLRAALAAGPAALRVMSRDYEDNVVANTLLVPDARERGLRRCSDLISDARIVEAAQEVAMKGGG